MGVEEHSPSVTSVHLNPDINGKCVILPCHIFGFYSTDLAGSAGVAGERVNNRDPHKKTEKMKNITLTTAFVLLATISLFAQTSSWSTAGNVGVDTTISQVNPAANGTMNALLLEKVEELTRYVIDLQNQIDELKKEKE